MTTTTVRFVRTSGTAWQGNGFGTHRAEWAAFIGDVQVGAFECDGRVSEAFGYRGLPRMTNTWKDLVRAYAARGDWL